MARSDRAKKSGTLIMIKIASVSVVLFILAATCSAAPFDELDGRIPECSAVLNSALEMPDRGIPRDLLRRCRGLAIFPGVWKVGLVVGASRGAGIVLRRDEKTAEWSRPAFFKIQSGSLGLQLGAQYTDLILLIMTEQGVERLLEEKFILGADISVAAGPVGREASADTNVGFESGILSYSQTKGLFAGLSLSGATLEPDVGANNVYHGKGITVQDVFYEGKGSLSDNARNLIRTLDEATK
jgi:lipid-binding SYLF domain-containing protein